MELAIQDPKLQKGIEFNFEELKKELTRKVDPYKNAVYTEDMKKEAKSARADLNRMIKVLNAEKIRVRKMYLDAVAPFLEKMDILIGIGKEGTDNIDSYLVLFEEKRKEEKLSEIKEYFESIGNKPFEFMLEMIFNERWLNATFSMKKVKAEIEDKIKQMHADMFTLQSLPEYSFEAIEVYKQTLDLNKAISEGQRLADIQKRKEEAKRQEEERRKKEEQLKQEEENAKIQEDVEVINDPVSSVVKETAKEEELQGQWVAFEAYLNVNEALELKQFFYSKNIEFRPVKEK